MKMRRWVTYRARLAHWCPNCCNHVEMEQVRTGLSGICCDKCKTCNSYYQVNYMEGSDDLLDCPDYFVFPKDWGDIALEEDCSNIVGKAIK